MVDDTIITAVDYGNAEVRGRLRAWKQARAAEYEPIIRTVHSQATLPLVVDFCRRKGIAPPSLRALAAAFCTGGA
jgi:hypothetical protein